MNTSNINSINDYIQTLPEKIQKLLQQIKNAIEEEAPHAEQAMSYGMPTYKVNGKNLIHFAGWKDHVAVYPTASRIEEHLPEVAQYRTGKGTLTFSLNTPLPLDLIRKIVQVRLKEVEQD